VTIDVRVPATSANLGPGFDVLGLALGLYNDIAFEEAARVTVTVEGEGAGRLAAGADNVVARAARMAYEAAGRRFQGAAIRCVNRIPPARGLGSSACAWVGGVVAANAALDSPAAPRCHPRPRGPPEGHPDNVAPELLGGLTISGAADEQVTAMFLAVPADTTWVVLVPETESSSGILRIVRAGGACLDSAAAESIDADRAGTVAVSVQRIARRA
jgi:homoserine kinase